jgi:hypothetical protein
MRHAPVDERRLSIANAATVITLIIRNRTNAAKIGRSILYRYIEEVNAVPPRDPTRYRGRHRTRSADPQIIPNA